MINFFDCLYSHIRGHNRWVLKLRGYSSFRYSIRSLANFFLPVFFRLTSKSSRNCVTGNALGPNGLGVIVSLTTYPGRINTVWLAIETLLRQSVKPDAVILWLSKDQFPDLSGLPRSLLKLVDRGLRIELRDGDIRSHKKYYFARREYPNATLILADDDIFYPTTMLKDLLDLSKRHQGKVICRFGKLMKWAAGGQLSPYGAWGNVNDSLARKDVFFGSGGGVLIPPSAVHCDLLNEDAFLEHCPLADDIWLNAMCRLVSPEMVTSPKTFSLLPVVSSDKSDLSSINNGEQMNDRQLEQVRAYCLRLHGVDPFCSPVF